MKYTILSLFATLLFWTGCNTSHTHSHTPDATGEDTVNVALYDMVMDIHNEVMPKSEDLYNLKKELTEQKNSKDVTVERKAQLDETIASLDSADSAMKDWMHKFTMPDSTNQEKAREYLETELERIKKVREMTDEAISRAKEQSAKK
jgi:hypothetical protein